MSGEEVDAVLGTLGGYGRYQWLMFVAIGLAHMFSAWHTFLPMFVGWPPEHHCTPWANHTLNQSLPWEENDSGEMAWSQCSMYQDPGSEGVSHGNTTVSCQLGWTYVWDREGETSTVSDNSLAVGQRQFAWFLAVLSLMLTLVFSGWDLVCDKGYLSELAMSIYMAGATCGIFFLSPIPDRYGCKKVFVTWSLLQVVVGAAIAFQQEPIGFLVLQFTQGVFHTAGYICGYIILVETLDKDSREAPFFSIAFFWAGAIMLLSLMAYLLPHWRYLQLAASLPMIIVVSYIWFLQESLSWLLNNGKVDRAREVISSVRRVNKLPPLDDLEATLDRFKGKNEKTVNAEYQPQEEAKGFGETVVSSASTTVWDLFRTPRTRWYSVIMFYLYFVNSLAYFGISFSMPLLSGDKYVNTFISGAVEIPAYIAVIFINRRVGRRLPFMVFMLICAGANIVNIFLPTTTDSGVDLGSVKTAFVMAGKFGITASYIILYLFGNEIFPTSIRSHAVGLCTFIESMGSIIAPQIVYAAKTMTQLPMTLFSVMTMVGAALVLFLPETHKLPLPQTMDDAKQRKKKRQDKVDMC